MAGLKTRDEFYNGHRIDTNHALDIHSADIETLKKANWTVAGVACTSMVVLEIGFRAFDYWLLKK